MAIESGYPMVMNEDEKKDIALWRLSILGPLISARLEHGDRRAWFHEAAKRVHQRPDGRFLEISARTIEAWYYAHRRGGFEALIPDGRTDKGKPRAIDPDVADLILRAKREKPRRSIRRIIRMLERARKVHRCELKRSTVHRLLSAHGLSGRPKRGPGDERRSFITEHGGDLWLGDALHGPRVIASDGRVRKAYMLSQIDVATRFVPHSFFALGETAVDHEYGFKQALLKHGRPRAYYVDLGAAYVARSLKLICAELDIRLLHTQPRDAPAKGAIERWHRTWREEVGDELPDEPLPLSELNAIHWAWLAREYHAREHDTTRRFPMQHWLDEAVHLRPLPTNKNLDELFLHREQRVVRKDSTVRFRGRLLEVRPELCQRKVELRFDPTDPDELPRVFVEGRFVCDTVPLDRIRNSARRRRRIAGEPDPSATPTGIDPLDQIKREHYERTCISKKPNHEED